jgi:PKD repeat protein
VIAATIALLTALLPTNRLRVTAQTTDPGVLIVAPEAGGVVDGITTVRISVVNATADSVEVFYRAHEAVDDGAPPTSLGFAAFDDSTGMWLLEWDTRLLADTANDLDTDGDGVEDTTVNITKPPTHDELSVVATAGADTYTAATDVRIQNNLTVRFTLPDNQEDLVGFQDLEALVTGEHEVTSVRFDVFDLSAADPRIFVPFGETLIDNDPGRTFSPIENPHYGRPLNAPLFPTGAPLYELGAATPEGSQRWVLRGWDTTTVPDGTYALVATAVDTEGRIATYTVETYIVNDLRVTITAPSEGDTVSRFVALEARTSSFTGADNAVPGGLFPATSVVFSIDNGVDPAVEVPAVENPVGSGRWRAVWDGDASAPGAYTITATATNDNAEVATHSVGVALVAAGADLEAFFPFDFGSCTLNVCSFLDGSSGGPTSWEWDFGDGNTSTEQLPTHTYDTYGVYTVSLTVSDDGGVSTDTYTRDIAVGNVGVVGFNVNPLDDPPTQFIDWTSSFKDFEYEIGATLAIPVMWETTTGTASFNSAPSEVCDDDEDSSNQQCVIFTPEEAAGTAPTVVGAVDNGVLLTMEFTEVQFRGITDIFKGKANLRVVVDVDLDGDGTSDQTNQLGTNVDVTNSGVEGDETRVVEIITPAEGQFVGGNNVLVQAAVVSTVPADQVEFFVGDGLAFTSIGTDDDGTNGWRASWDTIPFPDGPYVLHAEAVVLDDVLASAPRNVNVENAQPDEPAPPGGTFQTGRTNDTTGQYITYRHEIAEESDDEGGGQGGGPPPPDALRIPDAAMSSDFSNIQVIPGGGVIGGDLLTFDVTVTNDSPAGSGIVLSAFAFQSKFSESPALASRTGDKLFYGAVVPGSLVTTADSALGAVKKNGTSNGLFSGAWKGICLNSSLDFLPQYNSGLEDESLECAGNRADTDADGEPELQTGADMLGLRPGESQTITLSLDSGTTDGALHVVEPGTLVGTVDPGTPVVVGDDEYFLPEIVPGEPGANVISMPDFGDNKVLRDADGTFNPTFAPAADGLTFANQTYLTLPRRNFAFTDIIGRNHSCATYELTIGACAGNPSPTPALSYLGTGDLVPGVQNFAALLRGFGEFVDLDGDFIPDENPDFPDTGETRPSHPYDALCEKCGGRPYVPVAEFYLDNGDGSVTQSIVAGTYGDPIAEPYLAAVVATDATDIKEDVIPEEEAGGPCDPILDPDSRKPSCKQLRTSVTGHFHDLTVVPGMGINGGDAVEFTIDVTNTSSNPDAYLTAFNYQTKRRGLADIGILDGFTQDRRDIRLAEGQLPMCESHDDGACFNASLGVGHFPNVTGNGLLFGQMVWTDADAGREGAPVDSDQVYVDEANGIDPTPFGLESVKKNGPFTPILKGNTNFICIKSGLFDLDPDADAACAGQPAILVDDDGNLVPANIAQRLGLAPGETQSVRMRMEYGDFRGAMLEIVQGTLTADNVDPAYAATGGLARFFDCSDQRELEFCHPDLVGENIGYVPNTDANWLTPETLEEIEYVIINQPGDAPAVMNFQENFGHILSMTGFVPSAEFYAPDPNPDLVGTVDEGVLIRQQVLGTYEVTDAEPVAPVIVSTAVTAGLTGTPYTYDVDATAYPGPVTYSLAAAPAGMAIDETTGLVTWTPGASGVHSVSVSASSGLAPDAVQTFSVNVDTVMLDDFNRANGSLGSSWGGLTAGYAIANQRADVKVGGPIYWRSEFGSSQEAAITLTRIDRFGAHGVLLKAGRDHLKLSAISVHYDPLVRRIIVTALEYGKLPRIVGNWPARLSNGDRLVAQALADGSVRVVVNGSQVGTADAGSFFRNRGGHIGVQFLLAGNALFDDFGGGTIAP